MLVERAAEKPSILKLVSVAVQRARPAMTGKRDRFTHIPTVVCVSAHGHTRTHTDTHGHTHISYLHKT